MVRANQTLPGAHFASTSGVNRQDYRRFLGRPVGRPSAVPITGSIGDRPDKPIGMPRSVRCATLPTRSSERPHRFHVTARFESHRAGLALRTSPRKRAIRSLPDSHHLNIRCGHPIAEQQQGVIRVAQVGCPDQSVDIFELPVDRSRPLGGTPVLRGQAADKRFAAYAPFQEIRRARRLASRRSRLTRSVL